MNTRLRLLACLGTLVALVASRDDANAAGKAAQSSVSTAVLYTDGSIVRLAQDDEQSESTTQTPDNDDSGDDSGQSAPPTENPQ